jgi:hydrogenase maturation protease
MDKKNEVLIMGVGNVLLGDEGVGVHFVEYMKDRELPENTDLLDGGTGGFHLLNLIYEYDKMIIIDATIDDNPSGTIRMIKPKYSKDFPRTLSTHDIGLKDLIDTASVLEKLPSIYLIVVSIDHQQDVSLMLSDTIKEKLPNIETFVFDALDRIKKDNLSKVA